MTITVKVPSFYRRGGMASPSLNNSLRQTADMGGVLVGLDSLGRLYAHGKAGIDQIYLFFNTALERYDPTTDSWDVLASSGQYQWNHAWFIDAADRITYVGGTVWDGTTYYSSTDRGEMYDPLTDTWTAIPPIPVGADGSRGARFKPVFGKFGDFGMWILGGLHESIDTKGVPIIAQDSGAPTDPNAIPGLGWVSSVNGWIPGNPTNSWLYSPGSYIEFPRTQDPRLFESVQRSSYYNPPYQPNLLPTDAFGYPFSPDISYAALLWDGSNWQFTATIPERRNGAMPIWRSIDKLLYVAGGVSQTFPSGPGLSTAWRYDPDANEWTQLASMPRSVFSGQIVEFQGSLFVVGGHSGDPPFAPLPYITMYDPSTNTWTDLDDQLSIGRGDPYVIPDKEGTGFWIYSGFAANWGEPGGFTNTLEHWAPVGVVASTTAAHTRSYGTVIA